MGYLGYTGMEDGFEGLDSPMSMDGGDTHQQVMNGLNGEGMDEVRMGFNGGTCTLYCFGHALEANEWM